MTYSGILLIDKSEGQTSAQVVARVKRSLGLKKRDKVGHAGTLDPDGTGLLVCLLGRATRLASLMTSGEKEYCGEFQLGITTSTDDLAGEILSTADRALPSLEQVQAAALSLIGEIDQVPPAVSAVKVDGQRAYKRARAGESFEIKPRKVFVHAFEVKSTTDAARFTYRIRCGSGTYIRSLARDLGEMLGVGGAVATLRRTASSPFEVGSAVPLETLSEENLIPWEEAFSGVPVLELPTRLLHRIAQGDLPRCQHEIEVVYQKSFGGQDAGLRFLVHSASHHPPCGLFERTMGGWKVLFLDFERVEQTDMPREIPQNELREGVGRYE